MAKIIFTLDFKGSLEIPQEYLKLTQVDTEGNVLTINSSDHSPETIKEKIDSGEFRIELVESLVNASKVDKELEVDYKEDTGF